MKGGLVLCKVGFVFCDDIIIGIFLGIFEVLFFGIELSKWGRCWYFSNELVELEIIRILYLDVIYVELFNRLLVRLWNWIVEYEFYRNNFFIVSGMVDGYNYYIWMFWIWWDIRGFFILWDF